MPRRKNQKQWRPQKTCKNGHPFDHRINDHSTPIQTTRKPFSAKAMMAIEMQYIALVEKRMALRDLQAMRRRRLANAEAIRRNRAAIEHQASIFMAE